MVEINAHQLWAFGWGKRVFFVAQNSCVLIPSTLFSNSVRRLRCQDQRRIQLSEIHKKLSFVPVRFPHSPTITTSILIAKMVGSDQPPSSFKQKAFRKLSSQTSLRSVLSYDASLRPISAQSQRSFATCRSKMTTWDSSTLRESQSNDQLLYQKEFFDLAHSSLSSSSSASINGKLNTARLSKKIKRFVSHLKADWNEKVHKKVLKAKKVNFTRNATVDVDYDRQESFMNENYFVHSSDVPQYAGIVSSTNQKRYRSRIVTFDIDDDPFAAKSPMKLVAGKPVQPHQRERSLEVSRLCSKSLFICTSY